MNLVTPKVGAKHLLKKTASGLQGGFVDHLKPDLSKSTKCDPIHNKDNY